MKLTNQRISVPELKHNKWKVYMMFLSSIISICSLIGLIAFNKQTLIFSKKLKLVDNIFFFIYINTTFLYSFLSYNLLNNLETIDVLKSYNYLCSKQILVFIMGVQVLCCKYIFI